MLKPIDPDRVYNIQSLPADKAKKIFDQTDGSRYVLFVTTNDSVRREKI